MTQLIETKNTATPEELAGWGVKVGKIEDRRRSCVTLTGLGGAEHPDSIEVVCSPRLAERVEGWLLRCSERYGWGGVVRTVTR